MVTDASRQTARSSDVCGELAGSERSAAVNSVTDRPASIALTINSFHGAPPQMLARPAGFRGPLAL